jgi:hypothetical protein
MRFIKILILPAILAVYMLFFMATSMPYKCDADCEKTNRLLENLRPGRDTLQMTIGRCSYNRVSDTLCVIVNRNVNWDWPGFADTVCQQATAIGMLQQKVFILGYGTTSYYDTLAVKFCP